MDRREVEALLVAILEGLGVAYRLDREVKRGLAWLGAQQRIAGGGRHAEGIGWAIGLDRLLLALEHRG
jgi:hypothetical protein